MPKFTKRGIIIVQPSVLNKFFQNYNILPRSGVKAESLQVGSENTPNFVTFWPTLSFKDDQEKNPSIASNFSNYTQDPPRVKLSRTSVNQGRRIRRP